MLKIDQKTYIGVERGKFVFFYVEKHTLHVGGKMLDFINNNIISLITPLLLMAAGIYFSFKLKFFYLRHPKKMITAMVSRESKSGISPFRAVTLALAGTLGVGNIAGVASSIAIGGYGSVFWMWVSALVAMVLKYAEIVLAIRHRRVDDKGNYRGGAAYYIYDFFRSKGKIFCGKILAAAFALLCLVNSVTMGCIIQSNAAATSANGVMGISQGLLGIILAILCVIVISGSAKWISAFSEKTVPVMTVGYILLSVAVLAARHDLIGDALAAIFKDAFAVKSAGGGILGFLVSRSLKTGTMRGLMSNEAGCGTAPTAHASATTSSPAKQGFWGIFEVFVDTILLCTLTALVIIVAFWDSSETIMLLSDNPMMMAIKAYSRVLGNWSEYFMTLAVLLFAFATIACWAHYGKESIICITKKKAPVAIYVVVYSLFVYIGSLTAPSLAWLLADLALGVMTIINIIILFLMSGEVKEETDAFFKSAKY